MVGARCAGNGYFRDLVRNGAGSNPVIGSGPMWRNWKTRQVSPVAEF